MRISFITTVFNEEQSIENFLQSLFIQSVKPDEIVIVEGGSRDKTRDLIQNSKFKSQKYNSKFKILIRKGNRSIGRNEAIENATGDVIVCSDAGCILDKEWLKNITDPFKDSGIDIVSGFYKPITDNVFEKCLSTYTCVMRDKVDKNNFLPSSRSIAFKRKAWEEVGGYSENLDTCEDLVFAKKLKKAGFKFKFQENAIVLWPQRKNIYEAGLQFFNYAKGDGKAFYIRKNTPFLFARYIIFIILFVILLKFQYNFFIFLLSALILYSFWAVIKNYKYVKDWQAFCILPILQIVSDFAVMSGFIFGFINRYGLFK